MSKDVRLHFKPLSYESEMITKIQVPNANESCQTFSSQLRLMASADLIMGVNPALGLRCSVAMARHGDAEILRMYSSVRTYCCKVHRPTINERDWRRQDCAPGTCYSGTCAGFPFQYSMNRKCGPKNDNKECGGKWGDCCNFNGDCGTGPNFCAIGKCESGNCDVPPTTTVNNILPWQTGTTPDGTCGGDKGYTCDIVFGKCCSQSGVCGSLMEHCGTGW